MGLDLEYLDGQTPLEEEEKEGLLIYTISTRSELDEFEQQNIEQAIQWTFGRSLKIEAILTESFLRTMHKRMYKNVWAWAGQFRKTNKNIGIDRWQIPTQLKYLLEDVQYWYENNTSPPDEIAIRFKHRLVSIHCFPNGNGRHSRLLADILIDKVFHRPVFSWGTSILKDGIEVRKTYLNGLKRADDGDYTLLISFARS
jgi:Fic-DOC domain mobile mystery protein B